MDFAAQEQLNNGLVPVLKELGLQQQFNRSDPYFTGFKYTDTNARGFVGQIVAVVVGPEGRPQLLCVNLPGMEISLAEEGGTINIGTERLDESLDVEQVSALLKAGVEKLEAYGVSHGLMLWPGVVKKIPAPELEPANPVVAQENVGGTAETKKTEPEEPADPLGISQ